MKKSDPLAKMVIIKMLKAGIKRYALCFSTLIILFFCAQNSYSQITVTTTPADISSAITGNGFDAIISATAHSGNPVTLSVSSDIDAGSGLHFADLNPPAGTNLHLQAISAGDPLTGSWSFSIIATALGETALGQDFTINVRKPIDLMFVLDKSGSMTTTITGGTISRWVALKNGVAQFLTNYQPKLTTSNNAGGDQMGIRMFSDADAAPENAPFNVNNFIPVTPSTNLSTILDGDNPNGSTAMGAGLLAGRNFLFPSGNDNEHKKAILLFTDGEQNVPPMVVANPGSNPTVSGTDLTNGDKIQIHTIGLGIAGSATQTLYNIAHESGVAPQLGISNIANNISTTPPDLNLNSYLISISNQLYAGSTPQYVDVKRSNFKLLGTYFGALDSFTVSKRIDKIFINFMTSVTNQASVSSISKDGQSLYLYDTSIVKSKSGSGWQTFIISVSNIRKRMPGFTSDGNWKVNITSGSQRPAPYILSLTVDDHNSEMVGTTTQTKELVVGDPLPLSIDLKKGAKPITGATAIAIIAKPGDDLGDLLARTDVKFTMDTSADAGNAGAQKYDQLLKDSNFIKKLLDSNHAVNLTYDAAQKKYVGSFTQLDVSGVYQVAYLISANDTSLGQIKRYSEESVYIRFPDVNLDSSHVSLTSTTAGLSTLTFRPIASNGKFVGPGWGSVIRLTGNDSITNVVDSGDGSYTLTIHGNPSESVTLSIGTDTVYTGNLENIGKGGNGSNGTEIWQQWWFWLIVIIILLIIIIAARKKKSP